ncbi:hypothetical protein [Tabrizicola aquatica]|uniref:hypothetical protein n=1 Tax=Tabrizicola aquatica TaxID=909926 RepID=UPI000CD047D9|nr:hypothetical protein [Tabrizicola aquatica]
MLRALILTLIATPALAQDPGFVTLPRDERIAEVASPDLLRALVTANVVGMNCQDFPLTQGEWALLTGTAYIVATKLGVMDTGAYDSDFYGPAFDLLDRPGTCASEGPKIGLLVAMLMEMGGDTVLLRPLGE